MTRRTPKFDPDPAAFQVPIPADVQDKVRQLALDARDALPEGWGVTVLAFRYDGSETMYVSTARRADMVRALREFVEREAEKS